MNAGCGEAWGATSTVAAARTPSDRTHSGGACRGGKSSNAPEVWAWAGVGGGAARGKAMLSAYGLQTDKHTTCPRGTHGDGTARHGRWQRDQDSSGARRGESGGSAGNEGGVDKCGEVETGGGSGQRRGRGGGSGGGRVGDTPSDRVSTGQVQRIRGGKARKQRPSPASQGRSTTMSDRRSSEDRSASHAASSSSSREQQRIGDAATDGCDGGGRGAGQTSTSTVPLGDHREDALLVKTTVTAAPFDTKPDPKEHAAAAVVTVAAAGVDRRPAEHIQRALEDLLVRPRGSTASPHNQSGCSAVAEADSALPTTTIASGHMAILSMDGRGGSAAPPYRPQQMSLRTVTSASHTPVLPDLGTGIGTGTAGGAGMIAAFDTDSGNGGDVIGQGINSGGGDDHSTPPVSRQRSHSHHSPWQARKHPRGFPGGKGGAGFSRRHHHTTSHHSHPHERSLLEERLTSGSTTGGLRSCFSSESAERTSILESSSMNNAGSMAGIVAGAPQTMAAVNATSIDDNNDAPGDGNVAFGYSEPRAGYGRPTSCGDTAAAPPPSRSATVTVAGDSYSAVAIVATPQSKLIDHFKMAKRPTSRRGTRKQGGEEGEGMGWEGGDYAPEPAFCLFSRRGVGGGTSVARA